MSKVPRIDLVSETDKFFLELLKRVRTIGDGVDVNTQIDFAKELSKWTATRNKIAPDDTEGSKLNEYRDKLKAGRNSGGNRSSSSRSGGTSSAKGQETESEEDNRSAASAQDASRITGRRHDPGTTPYAISSATGSLRSGSRGTPRSNVAEDDNDGIL